MTKKVFKDGKIEIQMRREQGNMWAVSGKNRTGKGGAGVQVGQSWQHGRKGRPTNLL